MKLIVGLGNPGEKYEKSRHNLGFMVVEELARKWTKGKVKWEGKEKFSSLILQSSVTLAKPQTMMNASGYAVEKILRYYDLKELSDLWIVHDDLDLPLGKMKIRVGGGTAGHHGLESIVEQLGTTDFVRFRLGIGRPAKGGKWEVGGGKLVSQNVKHREVEDYILSEFAPQEQDELKKMIKKAVKAVELALAQGIKKAQTQYH